MMRILFTYFILILNYCNSQPILDDVLLKDYHYQNCIKTSILANTQNHLLDPIIKLNSEETLKLSFDDLSNELEYYLYTFIHCDSNWNKSEIIQSEYLEGFFENYIEDYNFSFNTIQNYIHYELIFPNENINFLKSGNYIVLIYDESMNPIITKRFIVYEDIVSIESNLKRGTFVQDFDTKHEIDFKIHLNNLILQNPYEEIKIVIQQNDNWNNVKKNIRPSFIDRNIIEYDYDKVFIKDEGLFTSRELTLLKIGFPIHFLLATSIRVGNIIYFTTFDPSGIDYNRRNLDYDSDHRFFQVKLRRWVRERTSFSIKFVRPEVNLCFQYDDYNCQTWIKT